MLNFKPVKNKENQTLKNQELYTYLTDGRLRKVIREKPNGKAMDSTTYEYFGQLTLVRHCEKDHDYNINIQYNEAGLVARKEVFSNDKSHTVEYFYNPLGRLLSVSITNNIKNKTNKHTLQYNDSGDLIELSYLKPLIVL